MNEILRSLHARKSVRAYTGEGVVQEEKRLILEAACAAPTAGNQLVKGRAKGYAGSKGRAAPI